MDIKNLEKILSKYEFKILTIKDNFLRITKTFLDEKDQDSDCLVFLEEGKIYFGLENNKTNYSYVYSIKMLKKLYKIFMKNGYSWNEV